MVGVHVFGVTTIAFGRTIVRMIMETSVISLCAAEKAATQGTQLEIFYEVLKRLLPNGRVRQGQRENTVVVEISQHKHFS